MSDSKKKASLIRRFLAPKLTKSYVARLVAVAACAFVAFGYVFPPFIISGPSMDPTYRSGGVVLGFRWRHGSNLDRGDVVFVRLAGTRIMYLKRVVALGGDSVAFRDGVLLVNDAPVTEDYVKNGCTWNLAKRDVRPGNVYVVGDNRSMPIDNHVFGQTSTSKIYGGPLW